MVFVAGSTLSANALNLAFASKQDKLTNLNAILDLGSNTTSNIPGLKFHSSANSIDYDSSIMASGGNSSAGQGLLTYNASKHHFGGTVHVGNEGWLTALLGGTGYEPGMLVSLSQGQGNSAAITGAALAYDGGSNAAGLFGGQFFAINNNVSTSGNNIGSPAGQTSAWGVYVEGRRSANAGDLINIETNVINEGNVVNSTPYSMSTPGHTFNLWLSSGRVDVPSSTDASLAIGIINNGKGYTAGINFAPNALVGTTGAGFETNYGKAIGMARHHMVNWYEPTSNSVIGTITSDVNYPGKGGTLTFSDNGIELTATGAGRIYAHSIVQAPVLVAVDSFGGNTTLNGVSIEMGNSLTATTPFIDFHSSGNNIDYDARILVNGGTSNIGQGTINFNAAKYQFAGNWTDPTSVVSIGNSTIWPESNSIIGDRLTAGIQTRNASLYVYKETYGTFGQATGASVIVNSGGAGMPQLSGYVSATDAGSGGERGSAALYLENNGPATLDIASVSFTTTSVVLNRALTSIEIAKYCRPGTFVEVFTRGAQVGPFQGQVVGVSSDGLTVTVTGWWLLGISTSNQNPTSAVGQPPPYIVHFGVINTLWGQNINVAIQSNSRAKSAFISEAGLFNNSGAYVPGVLSNPQTDMPFMNGYQAANSNGNASTGTSSGFWTFGKNWQRGFTASGISNNGAGFVYGDTTSGGSAFYSAQTQGYFLLLRPNDGNTAFCVTSDGAMEIGRSDITATPFIDFHSSGFSNDYDARIIAGGGNNVSGQGSLTFAAGNIAINSTFFRVQGATTLSYGLIELGSYTNGVQQAFIDFHSGGNDVDYDARIISSGGNTTAGNGQLVYIAGAGHIFVGNVSMNALVTIPNLPTNPAGLPSGTIWRDPANQNVLKVA